MIRNVVVGRLKPHVSREQAEQALAAIVALEPDGCVDMKVGVDAGLRKGNWSLTITNDFVDEAAYRRYDEHEEHDRVRRELFAPICEELVRVQIVV